MTAAAVQPRPVPLLVQARGLVHVYQNGQARVVAPREANLELRQGEVVGLMGHSGSGKTTMLNMLAGLQRPSGGSLEVAGHDLLRLRGGRRQAYRRHVVGYVSQQPEAGLLPALTVLQNVLAPMLAGNGSRGERLDRAAGLLEALRLEARHAHRIGSLGPDEKIRLAVAVALANRPQLLLADELTASLEWGAAQRLLEDVTSWLALSGTAALIVTHDVRVERYVERVVQIENGVSRVS